MINIQNSKKLIFSAIIIYNNNYFRQLEYSNFECTLSKDNAQSSTNYLCEVQIQNKDMAGFLCLERHQSCRRHNTRLQKGSD